MARWQNHIEDVDAENALDDLQDGIVEVVSVASSEAPDTEDSVPPSRSEDVSASQSAAIGDPSMYMPEEGEFPSILPGDIVYIPQETTERLSYKKGVYLGRTANDKHTAREWNSRSEIEVSISTLVRKTYCTEQEKAEAASLRAHQWPEDGAPQPRHYRKNHMLSPQACETLLSRADQLASGEAEIGGYDEGLVRPMFANFAQKFGRRARHRFEHRSGAFEGGRKLEDTVRIFYATVISEQSKDVTSSDAMWKADVERSAALLIGILIEVVEEQPDIPEDALAQLRAEQAQMIMRASDAVKQASGTYFKDISKDLQGTFDDMEGNPVELDSRTLEALKLRVHGVAIGQEDLLGFDEDNVKRTFLAFSQVLGVSPSAGTSLLAMIVRDFRMCAVSVLSKDNALNDKQRSAMSSRQEALLLSLLISVDARMQSEVHSSAPRIRSRFTSLLMEERARLLSTIYETQDSPAPTFWTSRADAIEDYARHTTFTIEGDTPHAQVETMERPPRVMRCYSCQHIWTSTLASDLRDCPQCGSYSVFAESPRRTASPDNADSHYHKLAPGEGELGQYFSERTDKYMNLYRTEQPLPRSTTDSHESLPNPWSHLHNPSNSSLRETSRTPPEGTSTNMKHSNHVGADAALAASQTSMAWYQQGTGAKPTTMADRVVPTPTTHQDAKVSSVSKICYTCRHRFAQSAVDDDRECPNCGSEFIFTDTNVNPHIPVADTNEPDEADTSVYRPGTAPPQLFGLIHDVEDVATKLQGLQDRHSKNTKDVPEAVDQLLCLSAGFKRLARLQNDPQYNLKLQRVRETMHVLCSSIQYTMDTAEDNLFVPLDETQWMNLCTWMRTIENVDILERLRWYQASIMGLLDHLDGFTSESLLGMDANIRSLLERQRSSRGFRLGTTQAGVSGEQREALRRTSTPNACYMCHYRLSDSAVPNAEICPRCGARAKPIPEPPTERSFVERAELTKKWEDVKCLGEPQSKHQEYTPQQLAQLIDDTEHIAAKLQNLQNQHPDNTSDIPEIIDQLIGLRDSFRKLSKLRDDPQYDPKFTEVQEPMQRLCRSVQHTLDAVLKVLSTEPRPDETVWSTWIMLNIRMGEAEKVELLERLRWYSASILGLLNALGGFPSAGRIFQWLGMHEKVRALLERQEASQGRE